MRPGRSRYGWYFRRHIPFLERVGRCLTQRPATAPPGSPAATPPPAVQVRGGGPTRRSRRWGDPTPAIDFITYCGGTRAAVPPAKVLDHWDISDHFPVIADLPGLTQVPDRGAIPPPPSTLGQQIVVEEKEIKHSVASSNYWQPMADSLEDEVEEALERAQAIAGSS